MAYEVEKRMDNPLSSVAVVPKYGGGRRINIGARLFTLVLAFIGLAAISFDEASARTVTFTPSKGGKVTVLALSEVDKLAEVDRCAKIKSIQATITRSGYRVRYRSPKDIKDPRDRALFEYENKVAVRYYYFCPEGRASSERLQFGARPAK